MAGTTSVSANAPKSEKMRGSSIRVWCQSPSGRLDAGVVPSRARSLSVMYGDGGAEAGPGPQNGAVGVGQAQAAVRGGVAPVATPVVVVKAGAVACEVLGEEYVGQVVAAWAEAWDADRVAVHRLVGDPTDNGEDAQWRGARSSAVDGQCGEHRRRAFIRDQHGRFSEIDVDPAAREPPRRWARQSYGRLGQVIAAGSAVPRLTIIAFDGIGDLHGTIQRQRLELRVRVWRGIERKRCATD